jgi:hypothetical protein
MSLLRRALASVAIVSVVSSVAVAAPRILADLTGKWTMTVATPDGTQPSTLTITQKNDSISGSLESQLGSAPVSGIVQGDSVKFAFQLDMGGQQLVISGVGAIKDKDNWGGVLDVAGLGVMPFSAVRQQ